MVSTLHIQISVTMLMLLWRSWLLWSGVLITRKDVAEQGSRTNSKTKRANNNSKTNKRQWKWLLRNSNRKGMSRTKTTNLHKEDLLTVRINREAHATWVPCFSFTTTGSNATKRLSKTWYSWKTAQTISNWQTT